MDPHDLINAGIEAMSADANLRAWAQVWYGKDMQIYIDPDAENPPDQDQCPTIQAHSPGKRTNEQSRTVTYNYSLMITVDDASDQVRAEDNVEEFTATGRLTAIIERAIAVIRQAKPDDGMVMGYEYETDTVSFFPVHVADVFLEFTQNLTIGQDPFD